MSQSQQQQQQASLQSLRGQLQTRRKSSEFKLNRSRYWFCLGNARTHGIEFLNLMGEMWFQHGPGKTGIQKFRFFPSKAPDLLLLFLILHTRMYQPILESVFGSRLICFDEYLRNYFEIMGTLMHKIWQSIGKDTHNVPFFSKDHAKDLTDIASTSTSKASQQKKQGGQQTTLLRLFTPDNLNLDPQQFQSMKRGCNKFLAFASIGIVFQNKAGTQVTKLLRLDASSRFLLEIQKVQEVLPRNIAAIALPDGIHDPARWKMTLFDNETVRTASAYIKMKCMEMNFKSEFQNLRMANSLFRTTHVNIPQPITEWSDRAITMSKCNGDSMSKLLTKLQSMNIQTVIKPAHNFCRCFQSCYEDLVMAYSAWSETDQEVIVHTDPTEGNIVMNQTTEGIDKDKVEHSYTSKDFLVGDKSLIDAILPSRIVLPNEAYVIDWGDACKIQLSDPIMKSMFKAFVERLKTIQDPEFNADTAIPDLEKQLMKFKKSRDFDEGHEMVRQYLLQAFRKHVNLFMSCMNGIGDIMYTIYKYLGTIYQAIGGKEGYSYFLRNSVCGTYMNKLYQEGRTEDQVLEIIDKVAKDQNQLFRLYMYIDFPKPRQLRSGGSSGRMVYHDQQDEQEE